MKHQQTLAIKAVIEDLKWLQEDSSLDSDHACTISGLRDNLTEVLNEDRTDSSVDQLLVRANLKITSCKLANDVRNTLKDLQRVHIDLADSYSASNDRVEETRQRNYVLVLRLISSMINTAAFGITEGFDAAQFLHLENRAWTDHKNDGDTQVQYKDGRPIL